MKVNLPCSFEICGRKINGTATEIINNDMNHSGDAIVVVEQTFAPRHAKDDPRHRHITFRVPLDNLTS